MDGRRPELPPFSMPSVAGWLRDTTTPGAAGPAVLVGHVDTTTGPAVFWKLSTLHRGAAVQVGRLDGHTAEFTVDTVRAYPRKDFPAAKVYGPNPAAVLRIVTCGGGYDRRRHEYAGNTILFAHLTGVR
jgi:sortase (surface protein transpeptidase)